MGFATFSMGEHGQAQIAEFQGYQGLITLLRILVSNDPIAQQYAALSIGNIASNATFRKSLIRMHALDNLIEMSVAQNTNKETKTSCAFALANLAASPEFHHFYFDIIDSIVAILNSPSLDVQKYAALIVQNLAVNELMWAPLVDAGVLTALHGILARRTTKMDAKLHATAALQSLTIDDNIKVLVVEEGFVREFVANLERCTLNSNVQVELVATLANISTLDATHKHIAHISCIEALLALLARDISDNVRFHVANCVANLCSNPVCDTSQSILRYDDRLFVRCSFVLYLDAAR
jgi:hypothetical protein